MALPIDFKVDKIIKQIQKELEEKFKVLIPYDTVVRIIEQQIKSTTDGMERGDKVTWKYFGTFLATKNRIDNLNKTYEARGKTPTLVDCGFYTIKF